MIYGLTLIYVLACVAALLFPIYALFGARDMSRAEWFGWSAVGWVTLLVFKLTMDFDWPWVYWTEG